MDLYAEHILDHAKSPRRRGSLTQPDASHGEANLSCGDSVRIDVRIEDNRIADIAWTGDGCAISQAGMSMLAEHVVGMSIDDALSLRRADVLPLLGVPISERRLKCALLSLHALRNTLHVYKREDPQTWVETVASRDLP